MINISNIKHKMLACFYTRCVNLKLFKQKLPKLLDCKMMSNVLKHPVYQYLLLQFQQNIDEEKTTVLW